MTKRLSTCEIDLAAQLLKEGELVAFPTETVYGLGASILHPHAVAKIYSVKGRPADNPLIVHIASLRDLSFLACEIPEVCYLLANAFWPGPLTMILKKHPEAPASVCAGLETIAMRMPSHPVAQALIEQVGAPLAAPSANLSGKPSATAAHHVLEDFEAKIAAVLDGGEAAWGIESTVISLVSGEVPVLLRPGVITQDDLEKVLGKKLGAAQKKDAIASPGMRYRHYAPKAPICIFEKEEELSLYLKRAPAKKRMLLVSNGCPDVEIEQFPLSSHNLYALFRKSDREGYEEILTLFDQKLRSDPALMNRIAHATGGCLGSS